MAETAFQHRAGFGALRSGERLAGERIRAETGGGGERGAAADEDRAAAQPLRAEQGADGRVTEVELAVDDLLDGAHRAVERPQRELTRKPGGGEAFGVSTAAAIGG